MIKHTNRVYQINNLVIKPFKEFKDLPGLIDKTISRERLRKVQDSTDIYNFKIDSTSVMQVTTDEGTYYTMAITRDLDYPVDMFENLIISDTGKTQDAYIASYKPNPIYFNWLDNHHVLTPFDGDFSLTRIDYKVLQKGSVTTCTTVNVLYCNAEYGAHPYGPSCKGSPSTFYVAVTTCTTWIFESPLYTSGSFPLQLVAPWGGGGGNGSGNYGGGNGGGSSPSPGNSGIGVFGPFKPGLSGPVTSPLQPSKSKNAQKIEDKITSDNLDDCSSLVLEYLKVAEDQDIAKMITKLDKAPSPYKLDIRTENTGNGSPGITIRTPGFNKYDYIIKMNPDYVSQATTLGIAAILVHEIMHAYFLSLIDDKASGVPNASVEIAVLFDAYVTKTFGPNSPMIQHEVMANKYVDVIAKALQEYNTGMSVAGEPEQVYKDLAWGGLMQAPVFQTLPLAERERINKRYIAEAFNFTVGTEVPVGAPCN